MFDVGRVCMKVAGRDAGKRCVIVDVIGSNYVLIDGETRRRKTNVRHLEPMDQVLEVRKGASHDNVKSAVSSLSWVVLETKPKQKAAKPIKARKAKAKPKKQQKESKKEEKSAETTPSLKAKKTEAKIQ